MENVKQFVKLCGHYSRTVFFGRSGMLLSVSVCQSDSILGILFVDTVIGFVNFFGLGCFRTRTQCVPVTIMGREFRSRDLKCVSIVTDRHFFVAVVLPRTSRHVNVDVDIVIALALPLVLFLLLIPFLVQCCDAFRTQGRLSGAY